MITVSTAIVNNEWYFTYNEKEVINIPTFADKNTSAIIGENAKVEAFATEKECYSRIKELRLIIPKQEI